jgi:hypothetical protein
MGRALLGIVLMAVGASGCGGSGTGAVVTGPELPGRIALRNGSSRDAWYAFTRRCDAVVWGEDELGPTVVLHPGQAAEWSEEAGCYDLLVLTNLRVEPKFQAEYHDRLISADERTAVTIAEADWTPMPGGPPSP